MKVFNQRIFRPAIVISIISIMIFLSSGFFTGCAGGAQAAKLSKATGQVTLQKYGAGDSVSASPGTALNQGDTVRTGADSSAVIIFFEGSVISLAADSEITIMQMGRDGGSTTIKLRQQIGASSSRIEKLVDSKSRYEVETPAGSALVRGSVMGVMVMTNGTTIVDAMEGSCWAVGQGVEVLLTQGQRSIIYVGRPPSSPTAQTTTSVVPPANPSPPAAFFNQEPYEEHKPATSGASPTTVVMKPPEVSTEDPLFVQGLNLRLGGKLTSMGTAAEVRVSFQYGTITGVYPYNSPPQAMNAIGNFYYNLSISPFYQPPFRIYMRAKADGGVHGIAYGAEKMWIVFLP